MRTSKQIRAEIEQTFGFFPPFYEPALGSPQVLENLWQQTLLAYIGNPLSAIFKEKLNALLSRFCTTPYCMIVHSAALRPLGMTAREVLSLLEALPGDIQENELLLNVLSVPDREEAASPLPGSALERTLLSCATAVFLEQADTHSCQAELRRLLGPDLYPHLIIYLGYIKMCHTWIEAHPDVSYEADQRAIENLAPLLAEEPALAEFFRHYQERVADVQSGRITQAAVAVERRRSDQAVRESEEKLRLLVDGAKDYAMILMDSQSRITSWNLGAERILGWAEAEVLGQPAALFFTPEDCAAGVPEQELDRASAEGRATDLRWHLKKDGLRFFADGIMECLRAEDGTLRGFAKVLRDATAQKQDQDIQSRAEDERRRMQQQAELDQQELRAAHRRTVSILESISDGFVALDTSWRFTAINDQAEKVLFQKRDVVLGRVFWDVFPETVGSAFERQYRRAVDEQITVVFEEFFPPLNGWFEVRAYPSGDGLSLFFQNVTERVERDRREQFLAGLAERARGMTDPDAVIADAVGSLGEFLGTYRCVFADIDTVADTCTVSVEHRADETAISQIGTFPISAFGKFVVVEFEVGRAVTVDDVQAVPDQVPPETLDAYETLSIRAHVTVPVVHSTRLVSIISCHSAAPRQWTTEEVGLVQTVVERTWLTVEVLRQQVVLVHEAEERRKAHERTAVILESIADAFYAVDREWKFTYMNSQAERLLFRTREELLGCSIWEEFPEAVGGAFYHLYHQAMDQGIYVSAEDYYAPLASWMDVRVYPSAAGVSVFFHNVNERKAMELERERLAERERNISSQLQAALQPELPGTVPGLVVTKYYEAALSEEAGVGGDFYDVFRIEKGCTALIVGDLSGKGLQAAAQVSTVRNMLRAFLYSKPAVVDAVTDLNRVLAENNLLAGFSTLFVGMYDSGTRTLNFVNCGQEPALLRRAETGEVELLLPTGPILGTWEDAQYTEAEVRLVPGDALAVFSDGLTEVGPNRLEMLGVEGVTALFAGPAPAGQVQEAAELAEHLALRLIQGVDAAAAGGVMRDDVCLLVAVAE